MSTAQPAAITLNIYHCSDQEPLHCPTQLLHWDVCLQNESTEYREDNNTVFLKHLKIWQMLSTHFCQQPLVKIKLGRWWGLLNAQTTAEGGGGDGVVWWQGCLCRGYTQGTGIEASSGRRRHVHWDLITTALLGPAPVTMHRTSCHAAAMPPYSVLKSYSVHNKSFFTAMLQRRCVRWFISY